MTVNGQLDIVKYLKVFIMVEKVTKKEVTFCGVVIPKGTKLPHQGKLTPIPTKLDSPVFVTVGEMLTHIFIESFRDYGYNRGTRNGEKFKTNPDTVASVETNGIRRADYGEVRVAMREGELTMVDHHSRKKGLLLRWSKGELTQEELEMKISIVKSDDFMTSYLSASAPGLSHNLRAKITNGDLAYGELFNKLENHIGADVAERILSFSTPYSTIFYCMHLENNGETINWGNWRWIYQKRGEAKSFADCPVGTLTVTDEQMVRFANAVRRWASLMTVFDNEYRKLSKPARKVSKAAGLFVVIMSDELSGKKRIPRNNARVCRNISYWLNDLLRELPFLCRGDQDRIDESYDSVINITRRKRPAA